MHTADPRCCPAEINTTLSSSYPTINKKTTIIQIIFKSDDKNYSAPQDTACLGLVHGDDPERCYGEGGGRGVHVWERMYTHGGVMSMYGKTNTVL